MSVAVKKYRRWTAEELASPEAPEKFVELIEGELIVMAPAGRYHNDIAYNITKMFDKFCESHPDLSFGGSDEGFLLRRNPDTVLSPDACLFRRREGAGGAWMPFAPEIAVEVLSPSNNPSELAFKRRCYFDAGTEQFWLVEPDKARMHFYHRDDRIVSVSGDETIAGEGIATGMRISLTEVFRER